MLLLNIVIIISGIAFAGGLFLGVYLGEINPSSSKQKRNIYLSIAVVLCVLVPILANAFTHCP